MLLGGADVNAHVSRPAFGIAGMIRPRGWHLAATGALLAVNGGKDFLTEGNAVLEIDYDIVELDLGGRADFTDAGPVRPWLGAGVAAARTTSEAKFAFGGGGSSSARESYSVGPWLAAGVDVPIGARALIGAEVHYSAIRAGNTSVGTISVETTALAARVGVAF